jgi:hypothetical protein
VGRTLICQRFFFCVVEWRFCRGFWEKHGAKRGEFVVERVVNVDIWMVVLWHRKMRHPFELYFCEPGAVLFSGPGGA